MSCRCYTAAKTFSIKKVRCPGQFSLFSPSRRPLQVRIILYVNIKTNEPFCCIFNRTYIIHSHTHTHSSYVIYVRKRSSDQRDVARVVGVTLHHWPYFLIILIITVSLCYFIAYVIYCTHFIDQVSSVFFLYIYINI